MFLKLFLILYFSPEVYLLENDELYSSLITKLKYNETCSYIIEQSRENAAKILIKGEDQAKIYTAFGFREEVLKRGEPLCSNLEMLVCSKDTQRCVCGDPGKIALYGHTEAYKGYVIEKSATGLKCRWREGSECISEDYLQEVASSLGSNAKVDSKCALGSTCLGKKSLEKCSKNYIIEYYSTNKKETFQVEGLLREMYEGKICNCKSCGTSFKLISHFVLLTSFLPFLFI